MMLLVSTEDELICEICIKNIYFLHLNLYLVTKYTKITAEPQLDIKSRSLAFSQFYLKI